jgi:hypothetical protein
MVPVFLILVLMVFCLSATVALMRDLFNQCQTFNLLVFHQKAVVASLKAHLAVKNSMAYQPLLE